MVEIYDESHLRELKDICEERNRIINQVIGKERVVNLNLEVINKKIFPNGAVWYYTWRTLLLFICIILYIWGVAVLKNFGISYGVEYNVEINRDTYQILIAAFIVDISFIIFFVTFSFMIIKFVKQINHLKKVKRARKTIIVLNNSISELNTRISILNERIAVHDYLPEAYYYSGHIIIQYILNRRADSLKEAINLFEFERQGNPLFYRYMSALKQNNITFSEMYKDYVYSQDNIEVKNDNKDIQKVANNKLPFQIYTFKKQCYKCHQYTDIITYIKYNDGNYEDVTYPWDEQRLLKNQILWAHIKDPSIEYYGLSVIGDLLEYDNMLMDKFPDKIQVRYSKKTKTSYPMNICSHCGAHQGRNFVYRQVNEMIASMQEIDVIE